MNTGSTSTAQTAPLLPRRAGTIAIVLFVLGLAAFALVLIALQRTPERAFHAYLAAYAFVLSLALGSLAFVAIAHSANTTWPVAVRRLAEAASAALPLLTLLFIPIALGVHALYPWANPERFSGSVREILQHRRAFLNPGGFALRGGLYLIVWSAMALALRHRSLAMERGADAPSTARRLRHLSHAFLPLLALTVGLSAFEWLMSLSPEFASTMYGALWIAACLFGGQACTVLLACWALRAGEIAPAANTPLPSARITPSHLSALGRLLFAYLIFLGYTAFFQFLLAWMGNRPPEAEWFLERSHGFYWGTVLFLLFGHFGLPFLVLLSYRLKRRARPLGVVAAYCLFCHYVHVHWLIVPAAHAAPYTWVDAAALVAVLALCAAFCVFLQLGKSLAPIADPSYVASLSYQSR